MLCLRSDDSAVRTEDLAVDPRTVRTCEKRDDVRDVRRLRQTLEWRKLAQSFDQLRGFAVQERILAGRAGCRHVHGDVSPAHLVGEDMRHRFYATLGRGIDAVRGLIETDDAR